MKQNEDSGASSSSVSAPRHSRRNRANWWPRPSLRAPKPYQTRGSRVSSRPSASGNSKMRIS